MKKEFNLGWGESVAVRNSFLAVHGFSSVTFSIADLRNLGYPKHEGDDNLVDLTRKIIKRQIGRYYDYILITNGATGGVTIALRAYQNMGYHQCWTADAPYFRFYPDMIDVAGLNHHTYSEPDGRRHGAVHLIDSPSNPLAKFSDAKKVIHPYTGVADPVIWDTVYFNNVYCPGKKPQPEHDVLVGSYSKFTGLNGLRVGWIATNDGLLYERMKRLVTAEYCGISAASTKIIMETAGKFTDSEWGTFETTANFWLDRNREEFSKLEKFFGNQPVPPIGMFYYAPIDKQCHKLLTKSNVVWSHGSSLGTSDDFGRFNVGQDPEMIKLAVKEILKNDKIK